MFSPAQGRRGLGAAVHISQDQGFLKSFRNWSRGCWSKASLLLLLPLHWQLPAGRNGSGTSHGAMSRKGLITDSFQVVKKKGDRKERKEAQSPPAQSPPQDLVQAESHPQDTVQPDQLEILKQFDLSWQYGPCTGITRMQRWERAKFLGLNPPTTVQDLLLKYNKDPFVIYRGCCCVTEDSQAHSSCLARRWSGPCEKVNPGLPRQ